MIKRVDIGTLRFTFSFSPVITVTGVNSYVGKKKHILMWDFDKCALYKVKRSLKAVQVRYFLSDIYIAKTKPDGGYHAYCFSIRDWQKAIEIIAATRYVDMKYLKWSVFRGRFTLRVSEKLGRLPKFKACLEGLPSADVTIKDLKSWVVYETVGGNEWWHVQMKNMQNWLAPLTCQLKRLPLMKRGKRH